MVLVQFENSGIALTSVLKSSADPDVGPTILELQGVLEVLDTASATAGSVVLGDFTADGLKAELKIGHHKLEGKRVRLTKPLVLLDFDDCTAVSGSIKMQSVIRYKYLFNIRPRHYSTK